mmetsp:Transcript_19425/g.58538  ORF Transcript_19425/g.58538 Transcript_19425/m.58538 type:complete len:217 (+) Transcript_19425:924-1574(+)
MRVDVHKHPDSLLRLAADEHSVGLIQVLHGRALRQELRVGQDPKVLAGRTFGRAAGVLVRRQDSVERCGRLHRHGRLLDDDLAPVCVLRDRTADTLNETEVCRAPGTQALHLRRRVHRRKNDVGLLDALLHVCREEQILATALLHNLCEAWLVDRQIVGIPSADAGLVQVHDVHLDLRTLQCNGGHGRPSHVAGTDAADLVQADAELGVHSLGHCC